LKTQKEKKEETHKEQEKKKQKKGKTYAVGHSSKGMVHITAVNPGFITPLGGSFSSR